MTNFLPVVDGEVNPGISSDVLAGSTSIGFGEELLGRVDKVWIVEWGLMPSSYMLAVARGAGAVGMRQYPAPELQGLFEEAHSPDGNKFEYRFLRYAGFGARNRVGAVAAEIGSATYSIPTGYDAPLSV